MWSLLGWLATGVPLQPESAPRGAALPGGHLVLSWSRVGWAVFRPWCPAPRTWGIFGGMQKLRADQKSVLTRVYEHFSDASIPPKR